MTPFKVLYIIRGIPNSGKTTLAHQVAKHVFEADDFFRRDGEYRFNPADLRNAHDDCRRRFQHAVSKGLTPLAVANTSSRRWEFEPYREIAEAHGYVVFVGTMPAERRGDNGHNVPASVIANMLDRWEA